MPRINSKKFYTSSIKQYGITPKGLNWLSNVHQQIRFDIILKMLPSEISSYIIADAGCGFGDFYFYLQDNNLQVKEYIGLDSLEIMCEIASKRTNAKIIQADITKDEIPSYDYYICSGALNILTPFETYQFLRTCFLASKKGFIFNILHGDKQSPTYNYLSTSQIKQIAKELKVKRVKIIDDYLDNDITIGFFK